MSKNVKIIFLRIFIISAFFLSINIFVEPEINEVKKVILNKDLNLN